MMHLTSLWLQECLIDVTQRMNKLQQPYMFTCAVSAVSFAIFLQLSVHQSQLSSMREKGMLLWRWF